MRDYLSACLCFKDSAAYLSEWLAFYTVLGVEHFYLYDNDSSDNYEAAIKPFLERGVVTLIRFPGAGVQGKIYQHCLTTYGHRTRWLLFSDDDEFLFPVKDCSLQEALAPYERYAGVAIPWAMYGSSGHVMRPSGLVIQNYVRRAAAPDPQVKCVVNPGCIVEPIVIAHQFRCRGSLMVDEKFHPIREPIAPLATMDVFRLNHYATKSREEMRERRSRIQANTGAPSPLSMAQWIALDETYNAVEDGIALRYVDRLLDVLDSVALPLDRCRPASAALEPRMPPASPDRSGAA